MKGNIKFGLFALAIFIGCGLLSCSKNEDISLPKNIEESIKIDRGEPVEVGLNFVGSHLMKNDNSSNYKACQKNSPHNIDSSDKDIYGIKICKRSILEPGAKMEEYAYGLFYEDELENVKFTGYNLEDYSIEATVINKGTSQYGLYHSEKKYSAPFYAELENKFMYGKNELFRPADYLTDMKIQTTEGVFFESFNRAELNRYFGCVESYTPPRTKKINEIIIDLYRVSFDLAFEAIGEKLTDNQRITVLLKTGTLPSGSTEVHKYTIDNTNIDLSEHKIIAFGLNKGKENTFYKEIFKDTDYMQKYVALAVLETFDDEGKIINITSLGESDQIAVQRNHKTTYTISVPEIDNDVKIGFRFKDTKWIDDEKKPFPTKDDFSINLY